MVKVAVAQLLATKDLETNTRAVEREIAAAASAGAGVVAFAETALTGYFSDVMEQLAGVGPSCDAARAALLRAEQRVRDACKAHKIGAVVGTVTICAPPRPPPLPWPPAAGMTRELAAALTAAALLTPGGAPAAVVLENSALVVSAAGEDLLRQPKLQLVPTDDWARPGRFVGMFELPDGDGGDGGGGGGGGGDSGGGDSGGASPPASPPPLLCAVIICHDSRHPELVRLPVLRGARLVFYVSWETWHDDGPVRPLATDHSSGAFVLVLQLAHHASSAHHFSTTCMSI